MCSALGGTRVIALRPSAVVNSHRFIDSEMMVLILSRTFTVSCPAHSPTAITQSTITKPNDLIAVFITLICPNVALRARTIRSPVTLLIFKMDQIDPNSWVSTQINGEGHFQNAARLQNLPLR